MFIKIYERERTQAENGMYDLSLKQIVSCRDLTADQYDELEDYFLEATEDGKIIFYHNTLTFELSNHDEILEDSPLPDGTVINCSEFKENGSYLVVMSRQDMNSSYDEFRTGLYL